MGEGGAGADIGDLVEVLLAGARISWDCQKPSLNGPYVLTYSRSSSWWGRSRGPVTNRTILDPTKAASFIKSTPNITRLTAKEWAKSPKEGKKIHIPGRMEVVVDELVNEEDLKMARSIKRTGRTKHQVIPRRQNLFDVEELYARRGVVDGRDRTMLRMMRDSKKLMVWGEVFGKSGSESSPSEPATDAAARGCALALIFTCIGVLLAVIELSRM